MKWGQIVLSKGIQRIGENYGKVKIDNGFGKFKNCQF